MNREIPSIPTFDPLVHQVADKYIFQNLMEICLSCWIFEPKERIDMTEVLVHLSILCRPSISENINISDFPPVSPRQGIEIIVKTAKLLSPKDSYSSILEGVSQYDDRAQHILGGVFSLIFFSKSPLYDHDIDTILGLEADTTSAVLSCFRPLEIGRAHV